MDFKVGFRTDIGRKRKQNQDSGGAYPELGLFVVADGMGGHQGGETASQMAVETIHSYVQKNLTQFETASLLRQSIIEANRAIYDRALRQPELHGMGTTTTALLFGNGRGKGNAGKLHIGQVGDSRCYFIRPSAIWQLTRDHSLVQEKLRAGLITREQLKTDRMKNVITRSVGFELDANVDVFDMTPQTGDLFLICSDGLSGLIDEDQMLAIVEKNAIQEHDLSKAVDELVAAANTNGGDDNITAVLIQVS